MKEHLIPKMRRMLERSLYMLLLGVSLAFLLIVLPYQIFKGLFQWQYIIGVVFWTSVALAAYIKLFGNKNP